MSEETVKATAATTSLASTISITDLFSTVVSWVASGAMIFGGAVPYSALISIVLPKTESLCLFLTHLCLKNRTEEFNNGEILYFGV